MSTPRIVVPEHLDGVRGHGAFADLPADRTLVMGILNATPDSFSDGGVHAGHEAAVAHALQMVADGADVVDVGGESTRPGARPVPEDEERERILPIVRELAARGVVVSVDTLKAGTARAAIEAGAAIVNDVSGMRLSEDMVRVCVEADVPYVLMHARGDSTSMDSLAVYEDTVAEVCDELGLLREQLLDAGMRPERIIVDPGLGFAKGGVQDWELLAGLDRLIELGHPVLVAASRKRFLGTALAEDRRGGQPVAPTERDTATAVVSALAARAGAWAVRVHDVVTTVDALAVERRWSAAEKAFGGPAERPSY